MVVNLKIMKIPETVNQHPYINEEQRILLIQQFNLNEQVRILFLIDIVSINKVILVGTTNYD